MQVQNFMGKKVVHSKRPINKKYMAAIVGLGNIGWLYDEVNNKEKKGHLTHSGAYLKEPNVILAGGVSINKKESLKFKQKFNVPVFESIPEMLQSISPDIISICSPTEHHFHHTQLCLENGIPMIWLEKPPSEALHELDRLIEMNKTTSSTILVSYLRRYSPVYRRLKEMHATRMFGKTIMVQLTYSKNLYLNGSHILDTAFYVIGDEYDVSFESLIPQLGDSNPSFVFKFSNGIPAIVHGLDLPYHCIDITLTCEKGRLSVLYGGMQGRVEVVSDQEYFPGYYRLWESSDETLSKGEKFANFSGALRDLIHSNKEKSEPVSNLITARKTQKLMEEVKAAFL